MSRKKTLEDSAALEAQKQTLKRKMMDLVAHRDHSEKELRQKLESHMEVLSGRTEMTFDGGMRNQLVEELIDLAKRNKWIEEPALLSQKVSEKLHKRHKGILFINGYLNEKGLPEIAADENEELEKALALVKNKYSEDYNFSDSEKAKIARMLNSRGFDSDTVRKVVYEKL